MTIEERNTVIESYLPLVRRLANRLIGAGQRPTITTDDLFSVGYGFMVEYLNRNPMASALTVLRGAKTYMILHIRSERAHWKNRKSWSEMFDNNGREKF